MFFSILYLVRDAISSGNGVNHPVTQMIAVNVY